MEGFVAILFLSNVSVAYLRRPGGILRPATSTALLSIDSCRRATLKCEAA
jgi:hypothetical protein